MRDQPRVRDPLAGVELRQAARFAMTLVAEQAKVCQRLVRLVEVFRSSVSCSPPLEEERATKSRADAAVEAEPGTAKPKSITNDDAAGARQSVLPWLKPTARSLPRSTPSLPCSPRGGCCRRAGRSQRTERR